jgi:hypothetical protein
MKTSLSRCVAAVATTLAASAVSASCGSAFCTLMTDRYVQGTGDVHTGWSADLRLEAVAQTRLRSGTRDIDPSQVTGEEAIERRTRNLNAIATLDYGFDPRWSLSLRVPVVRRDHLHDLLDDQTGLVTGSEQWRFTRLGDVQVLARRAFPADDLQSAYAWFGGLKLPTGSTRVVNRDGSRAERALQPGSGTTDLVLGVAGRRALGGLDAAVGQVSYSAALDTREQFRPGDRFEASAGWSHAWTPILGSVLQLNLRWRGHDRGAQAEPANSGSTQLDLSPGLTFGVADGSTLYAYVQVPLYQKVTGIQLVPRIGFALGWTMDF